MNLEHASRGYKVVANTTPTTFNFYGFTVVEEATISAITAPTVASAYAEAYDGDEEGIAGLALPPGYYPSRGSAITLTGGKVILWKQ